MINHAIPRTIEHSKKTTQQKQLQSGNHTKHNNSRVLPQRFNIPDGIKVVKKSVYQYIENCINNYLFGNYNISEVRSNFYNNLVHYSQLRTEDLNSKTLATYFQELNFNIIKYCEETYPVQSQYSINFDSETETSNKGKQKLKQYSKTTPNTPILPKTTAKHLQTPEQGTSSKLPLIITLFPALLAQAQTPNSPLNQFAKLEDFTSPRSSTRQQKPLQTSFNLLDFLAENQSEHSETAVNEENNSEISKEESINSENEEDKMTAYITKIPEFNREDIETSPQEWLNQVTKAGDANGWNAARMLRTIPYFLKETADKWFENLTTPFNDWTAFKTAFLEQFTDNNTSITLRNCFYNIKQELSKSRYEMAMEEANHTKLMNLVIGKTSSAAEEKIDQLTKKISTTPKIKSKQLYQQNRNNQHYPSPQQFYYQPLLPPAYYLPRPQYQTNYYQPVPQPMQQQYRQPIQHYQVPARRLVQQNQFAPQNQFATNNNRINPNNQLVPQNPAQLKPTHYHIQPSYLTISEEQNFYHTALSEDRAAARQQNPSYTPTTISPVRIAENANLSDIFSFEFEANESPFLLSNAATNEQKAITAMYTKAEVEGKTICLILNIPATCGTFNKCSEKVPAFEFKPEEEKPVVETFMALESTSNWTEETEQMYFATNLYPEEPETPGWNISYSKPEPKK
ncbi:hypothetical protein G9A89_021083 [Geosiphon pyriformis]|nr:hypothetical protein G9A89_021083 [Geosiphon pyriformis]